MIDKKILSIQDGLSGNLPDITTAKAGRFLITTDTGEMYYEPEDKKRVKINNADQTYSPISANAQSGKAVAEAIDPRTVYQKFIDDNNLKSRKWVDLSFVGGEYYYTDF